MSRTSLFVLCAQENVFLCFYVFMHFVYKSTIKKFQKNLFVWYAQESAFLCSLVFKETILKLSNSYNREHIYVDTLCRVHSVGFLVERLIYMLTECL